MAKDGTSARRIAKQSLPPALMPDSFGSHEPKCQTMSFSGDVRIIPPSYNDPEKSRQRKISDSREQG